MLKLDIDAAEMRRIADDLGASEKDLRLAFSRALSRTSRTLRAQARKNLREGLDLRAASVLKARLALKRYRPRGSGLGAARLWVGANDMPAHYFKGTPRRTQGGARVGSRSFPDAFVARAQGAGTRMVFKRVGRERLPIRKETVSVQKEVNEVLDEEVFDQINDLLLQNFRAEIRARTIYKVGR